MGHLDQHMGYALFIYNYIYMDRGQTIYSVHNVQLIYMDYNHMNISNINVIHGCHIINSQATGTKTLKLVVVVLR